MKRLWLLVALGCAAEDAEVLEAPNKYKACNTLVLCEAGLECRGGVCLPPLAPPATVNGDDVSASPDNDTTTGGDDVAVVEPVDVTNPSDLQVADDVTQVEPDTFVEPPDVQEPVDVPPQPDECTAAGQPGGCPFDPVLTYCRYEPATKNLVCQEGSTRLYSEPCSASTECEPQLGCHFGVCTEYCELSVKVCTTGAPCTEIGHPVFGACKQN